MAVGGNAVQVDFLLGGMLDQNGNPLAGGKVYTYLAGTSTAQALYTDAAKTTPATNPIILDAYGRAVVYGNLAYKFIVKDSADVTIVTLDNLAYNFWKEDNDGSGSGLDADTLRTRAPGNALNNVPISNNVVNVGCDSDKIDGYHAANTTGAIPISNGTLNVNLNSDKLDSQEGSYYLDRANHTGSPPAADASTTITGLDSTATSVLNTDTWKDLASVTVPDANIGSTTKCLITATIAASNSSNSGQMDVRIDVAGTGTGEVWRITFPATNGLVDTWTVNYSCALADGAARIVKVQGQGVAGAGDTTLSNVRLTVVTTVQ